MRNRRQRRNPRPLLQRVRPAVAVGLRLLAGMGLAAVLVVTVGWFTRVDLGAFLELNQVRLFGDLRHVQPDDVDAALDSRARGFFVLDLEAVRADLEALPWVETARLRKRWPDSLEVTITEPIPVARWGDDSLVDRHGEIFGPVDLEHWDFLPALEGENGRQVELMYRYLEVSARLADVGLGVSGIRESARRAWRIGLDDGGEILMGRDGDVNRLDQLLLVMPVLRERNPEPLARVDMRYARGMAVAWQSAPYAGDSMENSR